MSELVKNVISAFHQLRTLQSERDIYLDALKGIRDHEHCRNGYECSGNVNPTLSNGCESGHRCCSKLAGDAIEKGEKVRRR